jgi:GT2 family glycosyltransferase
MAEVTVVVATRNRRDRLAESLTALLDLPDHPQIIVVDNGSHDGTVDGISRRFPAVQLISLPTNHGAVARNIGVQVADTEIVAFADDDSGWQPGALTRAATLLRAHPRLGLIAARALVGDARRTDPVSELMSRAPLGTDPDLPGPNIIGFPAYAAVFRRDAFRATGGFDRTVPFVGEEERVAYDLLRAGWAMTYCPDVVAIHHPMPASPAQRRDRQLTGLRNHALTCWMRRPFPVAVASTGALVKMAAGSRHGRSQLTAFARSLPLAIRRRRAPSPAIEELLSTARTAGG